MPVPHPYNDLSLSKFVYVCMCTFSGENVEEAFLETAKKIYQNIQDGRFVGVFVELELLSVVNCTVHYVGTKPPFFIKPRCTHTHTRLTALFLGLPG